MIGVDIPIQAFMAGLGLALATFFIGCLLLLGAAIIRMLASDGFDEQH